MADPLVDGAAATASTEPTRVPTQAEDAPHAEEETLSEEQREEKLLLHDERSCIFETRVERAALCRDRGSAQFKLKQVARAIEWYERALYHVDFDEGTWHFEFLDSHRDAVNAVRLPVHLNLAMCYLGDGPSHDLAKVVEHADLALVIDAKNAKALYRGGKAHLLTGNLDAARKKLKLAAQIQPNDKSIREALQSLAEKTAEARAKEKETWGGRLLDKKTGDDEGSTEISTRSKSTKPAPASTDASEPASAGGQSLRSGSLWWTDPFVVLLAAIVTATVLVFFRPE